MNSIIEILLGAILSIIATAVIESVRRPKLYFTIPAPYDAPSAQMMDQHQNRLPGFGVRHRHLYVGVGNKAMPTYLTWLSRDAVIACGVEISFYYEDGRDVFGKSMTGRWSGSATPSPLLIELGGQRGSILDPLRWRLDSRIDIQPGSVETLDTVVRFDIDAECYGWSNENFWQGMRHPTWKLTAARYLIKATVRGSGVTASEVFWLYNNSDLDTFRLGPTTSAEKKRISA